MISALLTAELEGQDPDFFPLRGLNRESCPPPQGEWEVRCSFPPAVLAAWAQFSQGHFAGVSAWTDCWEGSTWPWAAAEEFIFSGSLCLSAEAFYIGTLSRTASVHCPRRYETVWKEVESNLFTGVTYPAWSRDLSPALQRDLCGQVGSCTCPAVHHFVNRDFSAIKAAWKKMQFWRG